MSEREVVKCRSWKSLKIGAEVVKCRSGKSLNVGAGSR